MAWRSGLANFFLRASCPICKRPSQGVFCRDCDRQIDAYFPGRMPDEAGLLPVSVYCWGRYDGALKRAIAACKFEGARAIAIALGRKLGQHWQQEVRQPPAQVVVPIPLHPQKLKKRGFNQAEVMAASFCAVTGLECRPRWLRRVKETKPQIETRSRQERESNLANAFALGETVRPQSVVVFDDILTSGATLRAAIALLEQHQLRVAGVIVLARTELGTRQWEGRNV
ncbi:MAG: ComF family protein [Oscillatoriales cyanobacterium SM2_2_1]|nr:ComF family protein [Oscillatoriales cyanobacterium SM2_2_1]